MGFVISIKRKPFLKRWYHKLFECPTFWKLKPSFQCPICGKTYRCYWDGHDEFGLINVCTSCYKRGIGMHHFQKEIGSWAAKTFPRSTNESIINHLIKEVKELKDSHEPEEAADCLILLFDFAHKNNFDLMAEVKRKFEINKFRKWGKADKDGVIEHIREED